MVKYYLKAGVIMVNFLRKVFIKDYQNVKNQRVREAHGRLASFVGVFSNLFLFVVKLLSGIFSKSVSIIADSINNLSDMGSSIVTLLGFKLANRPADEDHPYGHERMEYISGLFVAIIIIFVGGSLLFTSVDKIINYKYEEIPDYIMYITFGILFVSILAKLWQSMFNRKIGKLIDSLALEATACDSRNDVISTIVILIGNICIFFLGDVGFSIDGILGILVSLFIIVSGIKLIKETIDPLLGSAVSKEYVEEIVRYIIDNSIVLGVHDVMCHMYGPTKCYMSLHAEVDASIGIIEVHDSIDEIEAKVRNEFGIEITIHMDPIELNDEEVNSLKELVGSIINELDSNLSFHDFRMVRKLSKSTILFDIVIPFKYKMTEEEIIEYISKRINKDEDKYALLIHFDNQYVRR